VQNRTAFRLAYASTGGCKNLKLGDSKNLEKFQTTNYEINLLFFKNIAESYYIIS